LLLKISPNFEALTSRFAVFIYYQFKPYNSKLLNPEKVLESSFIIKTIAKRLGKAFQLIYKQLSVLPEIYHEAF
jgi:hypothetical protein